MPVSDRFEYQRGAYLSLQGLDRIFRPNGIVLPTGTIFIPEEYQRRLFQQDLHLGTEKKVKRKKWNHEG